MRDRGTVCVLLNKFKIGVRCLVFWTWFLSKEIVPRLIKLGVLVTFGHLPVQMMLLENLFNFITIRITVLVILYDTLVQIARFLLAGIDLTFKSFVRSWFVLNFVAGLWFFQNLKSTRLLGCYRCVILRYFSVNTVLPPIDNNKCLFHMEPFADNLVVLNFFNELLLSSLILPFYELLNWFYIDSFRIFTALTHLVYRRFESAILNFFLVLL